MILLGLGLWCIQRHSIFLGWLSRGWTPTRGKIVQGEVHQGPPARGLGVFFGEFRRIYTYEYHVAGQTYATTTYSCARGLDFDPFTRTVGSHVTIFYDPRCPERAVAKRGVSLLSIVPGAVLLVAGAYLLICPSKL